MKTAKLYRYGDINYWTGNYAEGGADLVRAGRLERSAQTAPVIHIRPASLTAERRAEVDKSFKGYIRLNRKYGYQTRERAYSGDKPIVMREYIRPKKTLFRRIHDFFIEETAE